MEQWPWFTDLLNYWIHNFLLKHPYPSLSRTSPWGRDAEIEVCILDKTLRGPSQYPYIPSSDQCSALRCCPSNDTYMFWLTARKIAACLENFIGMFLISMLADLKFAILCCYGALFILKYLINVSNFVYLHSK